MLFTANPSKLYKTNCHEAPKKFHPVGFFLLTPSGPLTPDFNSYIKFVYNVQITTMTNHPSSISALTAAVGAVSPVFAQGSEQSSVYSPVEQEAKLVYLWMALVGAAPAHVLKSVGAAAVSVAIF